MGVARVVTDYGPVAYLCVVLGRPNYRGQSLVAALLDAVTRHPALQHRARYVLDIPDTHRFYTGFGFRPSPNPQIHMDINEPTTRRWPMNVRTYRRSWYLRPPDPRTANA